MKRECDPSIWVRVQDGVHARRKTHATKIENTKLSAVIPGVAGLPPQLMG